jgi:hypothetical protein
VVPPEAQEAHVPHVPQEPPQDLLKPGSGHDVRH